MVGDIKVNPILSVYQQAEKKKTVRVSLFSKGEMVVVWLSLNLSRLRSSLVSLQMYSQKLRKVRVPLLEKSASPMSDIHVSNEGAIQYDERLESHKGFGT